MMFSTVYLEGDFFWRRKDKLVRPKTIEQAYHAMEEYIISSANRLRKLAFRIIIATFKCPVFPFPND
jgi:hypothetical protein